MRAALLDLMLGARRLGLWPWCFGCAALVADPERLYCEHCAEALAAEEPKTEAR